MNEEIKKLMDEIREGVTEKTIEHVEKRLDAIEAKYANDRKDVTGAGQSNDQHALEMKQLMGKYVSAKYKNDGGQSREILAEMQEKSLAGDTSTTGSEFVPEEFSSEVIRIAGNYGHVRRNATVIPMSTDTLNVPTIGDVTAYRQASQKAARTASTPTTGSVVLTAEDVSVMIPMSNQLLADANVRVIDLLTRLAAKAIAKKEDLWGIQGEASGEGIFQTSGVATVTMATGTGDTYAEATADDLLDVIAAVDEDLLDGARWFMSRSVFNVFLGLKDSNGQYICTNPAGSIPATLWGYPVEFVANMPKTSDGSQPSTKFIAFGNMENILVGDRQQMTIDISKEATVTDSDGSTKRYLFQDNMSAVRVIVREDIQVSLPSSAFAVLKTGPTS